MISFQPDSSLNIALRLAKEAAGNEKYFLLSIEIELLYQSWRLVLARFGIHP
jgi:hypothetical protein